MDSPKSELRRLQRQTDGLLAEYQKARRLARSRAAFKYEGLRFLGELVGASIGAETVGQRRGAKMGTAVASHAWSMEQDPGQRIELAYRQAYETLCHSARAALSQISVAKPHLCKPGNSQPLLDRLSRADDCDRLETSFRRVSTQLRGLLARELVWNSELPAQIVESARVSPPSQSTRRYTLSNTWYDYRERIGDALKQAGLLEHLDAIERELASSNPQRWRASVFSCRNLLTDIAAFLWQDPRPTYDHLPGSGAGGALDVTPDKVSNRLSAYLHQKGLRDRNGKLLQAEMERLATSFRSLLALQGTAHKPVKREQAESAALHTCLLIGQLASGTDMEPVLRYGNPAVDHV